MKVEIIGGNKLSSEYLFAASLKKDFIDCFGENANDERFVWIFPNHDCSGNAGVRDVDILVYADVRSRVKINGTDEYCYIQNFAANIELCNRDEWWSDTSNHIWVDYGGDEHDKTFQNNRQVFALKEQIKRASIYAKKQIASPYFISVLWMTAANQPFSGDAGLHTLCGRQGVRDLLQLVAQGGRPVRDGEDKEFSAWRISKSQQSIRAFLRDVYRIHDQQQKKFGSVTRKQIDAISGNILIKKKDYAERGLDGFLVLTGDPGTGKTITLLNLAYQLLSEHKTALFLTYNIALACDVRQMWWHLNGAIQVPGQLTVRSSFSFFGSLWNHLNIDISVDEFFRDYEKLVLPLMHEQIMQYTQDQVTTLRRKNPELFGCSKALIDEGQDWDQREVEIIEKIFGAQRLLVAQSMTQLVRKNQSINWYEWLSAGRDAYSNLTLRESMRQKQSLLDFNRRLADHYKFPVRLSKSALAGGSVRLITGEYRSDIHVDLLNRHLAMKATLYEFLFLVPSGYDFTRNIANNLKEVSETSYIDLSSHELRKTFEQDGDLYNQDKSRVLNYDSARGLEGWTCVCLCIDRFYSSLPTGFVPQSHRGSIQNQQTELVVKSEDDQLREFIFNWLLIPLTRAIDTLVLHVEDPTSDFAIVLQEAIRAVSD
jgi:DNA polymerase III delta prime subunit